MLPQVKIGGNVADACTLYNFPRGNDPAGTRSLTVYDYSAVDELPEIRCKVPSGVGNGNDLEVSWHGVAVTISNWFKYSKPIVRRVSPVSVSYSGGDKITIYGNNFGPQAAWATGSNHPVRSFKLKCARLTLVPGKDRALQSRISVVWQGGIHLGQRTPMHCSCSPSGELEL